MRVLFKYHRYLGLFAAIFVITLATTGMMLNHTERFRLDERVIEQGWLLALYGMADARQGPAFKLGEHWLLQSGEAIYLDQQPLSNDGQAGLRGAAWLGETIIVAYSDKLALYSTTGALIDTLSTDAELQAVGRTEKAQVRFNIAGQVYQVDQDFTALSPSLTPSEKIHWERPSVLPKDIEQWLQKNYRGTGLTLERVILDLHSGRLFGGIGVFLMDAAAILMLILTLSGMGIWVTRVRRRNQRRRPGH